MAPDGVHLSSHGTLSLTDLPLELVQHILAMLPVAERAMVAPTCRQLAAALGGSAAATSSCWREATLRRQLLSANGMASLLAWAAALSKDIQRLWLMAPIIFVTDRGVMDMTHIFVGLLRAVHTLRIEYFHDDQGAPMCATLLASKTIRPSSTVLMHLALYNLTMAPDDAQLVGAILGQNKLVELTLKFHQRTAPASADATATVLTAAGACQKLKRLRMKTYDYSNLGLPCLPASVVAHASLASIDLQLCGLWGPQQLPAHLTSLKLADCGAYQLPASLACMTALTQLAASSLTEPPPAWPPFLQDLKLGGQRWDTEAEELLGPCLASLTAVTALRFLHLDSCTSLSTSARELQVGTAPLAALKGLALTRCNLRTLPQLDCLSRLRHLALSDNPFSEVPQLLLAATACEGLDLSHSLNATESLDDSAIHVLSRLTALTRLSIDAGSMAMSMSPHPALQLAQMRLIAIVDLAARRKPGDELPSTSLFPAALPDVTSPMETKRGWLC